MEISLTVDKRFLYKFRIPNSALIKGGELMATKDDANNKKKKKSVIASLDLKNYKAKYTDSYGLGKPNEVDLDNFLIAEPDSNNDTKKAVEEKINIPIKPVTSNSPKNSVTNNVTKVNELTENNTKIDNNFIDDDNSKVKITAGENKIVNEALNIDSDFDKRINHEADNDFYDDKPIQKRDSAFRSNVISNNSKNEQELEDVKPLANLKEEKGKRKLNIREPVKVNVRHEIKNNMEENVEDTAINTAVKEPQRRTETYGIIISAIALLYSIKTADRALFFLSTSLVLYLMRPIIAAPFGKHSDSIQNAIKGFSIALFFGAIFSIFF